MRRLYPHLPKNVWLYFAFTFLHNMSFFSAILVPFFTDWGHITITQTLLIQSWFAFWVFVLEIPTGAVADYLGRKYSLVLGAGFTAIATYIYGTVPQIPIFLLAEFLYAVGFALMSGADEALLYDTLRENGLEKQKNRIFGQAQAISLAGILVAAPIGSYLAGLYGLNRPTQFTSIPYILAAIVIWFIHEPVRNRGESESSRYLDIVKDGLKYLWSNSALKILALDAIAIASIAYYVIWFYQPLLESVGIPIRLFGWFNALLLLSEILISMQFNRLEKFFGSVENMARLGAIITGCGFIITALIPHPVTIIVFIIFSGGFGLTRLTYMSAQMNLFIPSSRRATVLSSASMFRRFANMGFNPLVGALADISRVLTFLILGLIAILVGLFSPLKKVLPSLGDGGGNGGSR